MRWYSIPYSVAIAVILLSSYLGFNLWYVGVLADIATEYGSLCITWADAEPVYINTPFIKRVSPVVQFDEYTYYYIHPH